MKSIRDYLDLLNEEHRITESNYAWNSNLNYHLINGNKLKGVDKEIHDRIINHDGDKVEKNIYYSGISPEFARKIENSDQFYSPAHISTSSNERIAKEYAERRAGFRSSSDAYIVRFHLPDTYKNGIKIKGFSVDEMEYLLKSGQTFRHKDPTNKVQTKTDEYGRKWHQYDLEPTSEKA